MSETEKRMNLCAVNEASRGSQAGPLTNEITNKSVHARYRSYRNTMTKHSAEMV